MQDLLNINTINRKEAKDSTSLYFVGSQHQKYKQAKHLSRCGTGAPLRLIDSSHHKLTIILKRKSSNSVVIMLLPWVILRCIKKTVISSLHSDVNHKIILKLCGSNHSHLLLYQECNATIEVRHILSLKQEKVFNLQTICKTLEINAHFSGIKVSLDAVYVPDLSAAILCLGSLIVICKDDMNSTIIYQFLGQKTRDRFINLQYNCSRKALLAESITSIILFEFDSDGGITGTQVFHHPYLKSLNTRIVDWDPTETMLISAFVTKTNKENIYVFNYENNCVKVKGLIEDKRVGSTFYSREKRRLLYVDEDISGLQSIRSLPLSLLDDGENIEDDDEERRFEGDFIAYVPEVAVKSPICIPMYQKNTLFIRFSIL